MAVFSSSVYQYQSCVAESSTYIKVGNT